MNLKIVEFSVFICAYFIVSLLIFNYLHNIQPTPLIDEVFHIPQGLKYCHGNFSEWDPKITTLPGLYIISFSLLRIPEFIGFSSLCNAYNLKLINVLSSIVSLIVMYSIGIAQLKKEKLHNNYRFILWSSFNISILPVSFFFNFFYYTDTMSTLFVLLMYRMHLAKHFLIAASLGACSVLIRQTNIIWVGYVLLDMVKEIVTLVQIRGRKLSSSDINLNRIKKHFWNEQKFVSHVCQLLQDAAGYLVVCVSFLLFLVINKGIVVGDKSAHTPVVHICQIFYYSLFSLFFGFPHFIEKIQNFLICVNKNKKYVLIFVFIASVIVHYNTMAHPYILSDNRHYSFYIWKRVFENHIFFRYLLVPVYFFGLYCLNESIRNKIKIDYWLCCALCLVPQKLLEFRYFLLPYIIYRIQLKCKTWWHLAIESVFFLLINFVIIQIFATKEFYWPDSNKIQRIIW